MKKVFVFFLIVLLGTAGGWIVICTLLNGSSYARKGDVIDFNLNFLFRVANTSTENIVLMALLIGFFLGMRYIMSKKNSIKNVKGSSR